MTSRSTFSLVVFLIICLSVTIDVRSQEAIPKLSFSDLEEYLHIDNDTTYVINFWATWCGPCVKELPHFEELNKSDPDKKIKVILVSLDFPQQYDNGLIPFIKKKEIKSKVLFLDDGKANVWIPKVDEGWSGAIPATLIYKGKKRWFHEGSLKKEEIFKAAEEVSSF